MFTAYEAELRFINASRAQMPKNHVLMVDQGVLTDLTARPISCEDRSIIVIFIQLHGPFNVTYMEIGS